MRNRIKDILIPCLYLLGIWLELGLVHNGYVRYYMPFAWVVLVIWVYSSRDIKLDIITTDLSYFCIAGLVITLFLGILKVSPTVSAFIKGHCIHIMLATFCFMVYRRAKRDNAHALVEVISWSLMFYALAIFIKAKFYRLDLSALLNVPTLVFIVLVYIIIDQRRSLPNDKERNSIKRNADADRSSNE